MIAPLTKWTRDALIVCAALRYIDPEGALPFFLAYLFVLSAITACAVVFFQGPDA